MNGTGISTCWRILKTSNQWQHRPDTMSRALSSTVGDTYRSGRGIESLSAIGHLLEYTADQGRRSAYPAFQRKHDGQVRGQYQSRNLDKTTHLPAGTPNGHGRHTKWSHSFEVTGVCECSAELYEGRSCLGQMNAEWSCMIVRMCTASEPDHIQRDI